MWNILSGSRGPGLCAVKSWLSNLPSLLLTAASLASPSFLLYLLITSGSFLALWWSRVTPLFSAPSLRLTLHFDLDQRCSVFDASAPLSPTWWWQDWSHRNPSLDKTGAALVFLNASHMLVGSLSSLGTVLKPRKGSPRCALRLQTSLGLHDLLWTPQSA